MDVGRKLKEYRKANGLTQEELAERLIVTRAAISRWETGRGIPEPENLKGIADLLGISVDELLDDGTLSTAEEKETSPHATRKVALLLVFVFVLTAVCATAVKTGDKAIPLCSRITNVRLKDDSHASWLELEDESGLYAELRYWLSGAEVADGEIPLTGNETRRLFSIIYGTNRGEEYELLAYVYRVGPLLLS